MWANLDNFGQIGIVAYTEGEADMKYTKSFYSPAEVAEMAGVHPSTVLNYISSGRLYAVRLSERTIRVPVRAVVGLLEPERLRPPVVVDEPDADVEFEIESETEVVVGAMEV